MQLRKYQIRKSDCNIEDVFILKNKLNPENDDDINSELALEKMDTKHQENICQDTDKYKENIPGNELNPHDPNISMHHADAKSYLIDFEHEQFNHPNLLKKISPDAIHH